MNDKRADGVREARSLFHERGSGAVPTSALQLEFNGTDIRTARTLNRLWHSRLPRFGRPACRQAYTASFDGRFYAVAIWTNPLSRRLPQMEWLELNRMAIAQDAPKNTASRMLGWMTRDIRQRFPDVVRLVSYQDMEVHTGCIYKASGWVATVTTETKNTYWNCNSRDRSSEEVKANKQRWEKVLYERDESSRAG